MRNGGYRGDFKDSEEYDKAYCEGYEHGYQDASEEMQGGESGMPNGLSPRWNATADAYSPTPSKKWVV